MWCNENIIINKDPSETSLNSNGFAQFEIVKNESETDSTEHVLAQRNLKNEITSIDDVSNYQSPLLAFRSYRSTIFFYFYSLILPPILYLLIFSYIHINLIFKRYLLHILHQYVPQSIDFD